MLPHMDGWYLIRQGRAQLPHLPIIVTTGRTNEHDRLDVLALGADDVMAKPFSMRELVARVAASLRRAAEPCPATRSTPWFGEGGVHTGSRPHVRKRAPRRLKGEPNGARHRLVQ